MRISDWSSDVCSSDLCEQEKQDGAENLSNAPDQNEIIEIPAPPQAAKAQPYTKQIRKNLGISYCAETPRKPQHGSRHAGNIQPQGDAIDQDESDIIGLQSEKTARGYGEQRSRKCRERKSVVEGKKVSVSVDHGGARIIKK